MAAMVAPKTSKASSSCSLYTTTQRPNARSTRGRADEARWDTVRGSLTSIPYTSKKAKWTRGLAVSSLTHTAA